MSTRSSASGAPLLTIAIPTWNRATYLADLLPQLSSQVAELLEGAPGLAEVFVSDNGSTDGTPALLQRACEASPFLRTRRSPTNLGFTANYRACLDGARGRYLWVLGDDDLLEEGAVARLAAVLAEEQPAMLVALDALRVVGVDPAPLRSTLGRLRRFPSYQALLAASTGGLRRLAIAHTWIPSVVLDRRIIDLDEFDRRRHTDLAQSYAPSRGLRRGGAVVLYGEPMLKLRAARAPHDHLGIPRKQARYLLALGWSYRDPRVLADGARAYARSLASACYQWLQARSPGRPGAAGSPRA